ncbi:hypothetical protein [Acinetobacter sp. SFB]|uniref:hypothetical protein n=1 Tax=Acinetobacter sp. SFB TaxID=1805634 RepID=UPI002018102A|nr:hypothetical protein [Acinetobacter sp. SFB]
MKKQDAKVALRSKKITSSAEVRKYYMDDAAHWQVFQRNYNEELLKQPEVL